MEYGNVVICGEISQSFELHHLARSHIGQGWLGHDLGEDFAGLWVEIVKGFPGLRPGNLSAE